jgi:hypothetical protein
MAAGCGITRREIADRLPAPSPRGLQRAMVRLAVVDDMIQQQMSAFTGPAG